MGERGRYRGLLIGNAKFPRDPHGLPTLNGPLVDVEELRQTLADDRIGLFQAADLQRLKDRKIQELREQAEKFFISAVREDVLLLYYSGHGQLDERGTLYLCANDTRTSLPQSSGLSSREINYMIDRCAATTIITILDCCYSGSFKSAAPAALDAGRGRYLLTSGRSTELALAATRSGQPSPFTGQLVRSLRTAQPANSTADLTIDELYRHVHRSMTESPGSTPQLKLAGEGDVVIARRPRPTPPPTVQLGNATGLVYPPDTTVQITWLSGLSDRDLTYNSGQLKQLPNASPPYSGEPRQTEVVEKLAIIVRERWKREREQRRETVDPYPLPVRFRPAKEDLFDHSANIRRSLWGTDSGPLVEAYRSLPSGRLVVLGAAGSGKTILTLRFVLDCLSTRTHHDPVPVIFGPGSWDPTTTPLTNWIRSQLVRDYAFLAVPAPHGGNLADTLVEEECILPVLDGFDEIASNLQPAALAALNATTMPLLLISRRHEYERAMRERTPLNAAACVEVSALTPDDFADYLRDASPPLHSPSYDTYRTVWDPVLERLRNQPDSPAAANLAAALDTPLMVAGARRVYSDEPGRDPSELLDTARFATVAHLREHLLAAFIPDAWGRP
ncbi:caspase family protein [Streptomyces sp. NPDC057555]|uniref:caspase, EACC1-associated type n=1 Tax=Streptomyces sp. NPDC057555 TaxID=3346166 RepID=UPI0036A53DD3